MSSRKLVMLGLLGAVSVTVPALAQQSGASSQPYAAACSAAGVSSAKSEEAHAFYNAGRALYDEGNYDGAIAQFREAYRRDCSKHDLLIIISRSYELKGDKPEAVKALELYLERVKDGPDAATHRTKIENLKKQIAAQPPPPPTVAPTATVEKPPAEIREHTLAPWLVVGLGGAGVVTGIIFLVAAPALPGNCNGDSMTCQRKINPDGSTESNADYSNDQNNAGNHKSFQTLGTIFLVSGAAVAVGGLVWHFLEPTGPVTSTGLIKKPIVTPSVGPGYAAMSLGGTF